MPDLFIKVFGSKSATSVVLTVAPVVNDNDLRSSFHCGAPAYFADHPKPTSPQDLLQHQCVNYRHGSGEIYRWELDKEDQSVVVAVNGPLITNDIGLLTRAALDGVGLAFMSEEQAAPHLANGALVRVLEDWCPPFPGFFLYYPSRRQHPAALTALIETLRV